MLGSEPLGKEIPNLVVFKLQGSAEPGLDIFLGKTDTNLARTLQKCLTSFLASSIPWMIL